jgi:hypothetical protein
MSDARKKKAKTMGAAIGVGAGVIIAVVVTLGLVLGASMDQSTIYPEDTHSVDEPVGEPPAP